MNATILSDETRAPPSPAELRNIQRRLLRRFAAEAPFQPATNLWRAIELPVLAEVLPRTGRGLDVGCGDGVLTAILRDLLAADWELAGVDPDPAETALAATTGIYEQVHTTGADRIAEPDGSFDFAFSNSVLEHISRLPACLAEIARCLRPGAPLLATVPSPGFHECLKGPGWTRRMSRQEYLDETDRRLAHRQYWSQQRWSEELQAAGFEPPSITGYLSRRQVRRWELLSNWTGGLLHRLRGGQSPIEIQRRLGLRRAAPWPLRWLAGPVARFTAAGVLGAEQDAESACYLIEAVKRG